MRVFQFKYKFILAIFPLIVIGSTVSTYAGNEIEFNLGRESASDIILEDGTDDIKPTVAFGNLDIGKNVDIDCEESKENGIRFEFSGEDSTDSNEFSQSDEDNELLVSESEEIIIYEPEPADAKGYRQVRYFEPYSYDMNVEATFYFYHDVWPEGSGTGLTYTGNKCVPWYTIAVDPSVIPLGSKVIINGREYLADDIGGAIKGNKIDIATWSREEAFRYGRRYLDIKVIPPGGKGEYKVVKISPDKAEDKEYISSLGEQAVLID